MAEDKVIHISSDDLQELLRLLKDNPEDQAAVKNALGTGEKQELQHLQGDNKKLREDKFTLSSIVRQQGHEISGMLKSIPYLKRLVDDRILTMVALSGSIQNAGKYSKKSPIPILPVLITVFALGFGAIYSGSPNFRILVDYYLATIYGQIIVMLIAAALFILVVNSIRKNRRPSGAPI